MIMCPIKIIQNLPFWLIYITIKAWKMYLYGSGSYLILNKWIRLSKCRWKKIIDYKVIDQSNSHGKFKQIMFF
jgi:hypothetical protein